MKPIATLYFHGADIHRQVEKWAEVNGYVIASMQRDGPRGMMPAALYDSVAKWRNLTIREQKECHAVATFIYDSGGTVATTARVEQFKPSGVVDASDVKEKEVQTLKDNVFHQHLDVCRQCREHPFALCKDGMNALARAAGGV